MLPKDLIGPGMTLSVSAREEVSNFVARAAKRYPDIHSDFITDVCFEGPSRFDDYFPNFDAKTNKVIVHRVTARWVKENVRYDDGESIEFGRFFGGDVDEYNPATLQGKPMVKDMISKGTWPFRPIIIEYGFGVGTLGSEYDLGSPYHLFEGCHRTSYLLRMLALGYITADSEHDILVVV
jgi:hypothetical protein